MERDTLVYTLSGIVVVLSVLAFAISLSSSALADYVIRKGWWK